MAGLRIFVSSTCFDLGSHRDQIRSLLLRMGYEPIMSDHSDVLYDPKDHTHTSCVKEVSNADMVILLIGSRFGGTVVSQALPEVDFDRLTTASSSSDILAEKEKLSITQLEIMKAVEADIPVFAFVNDKVYSDHHVYQSNKNSPIIDKIKFPSIEKAETAKYIFGFINFISHRVSNNALVPYSSFGDIEEHLVKQWSLLFQRMLRDQREKALDQRRGDIVIEQIEGLKAVVLQSISSGAAREVARSVVKYRRLIDTLLGLRVGRPEFDFGSFVGSFEDLLSEYSIVDIVDDGEGPMARTFLVRDDGRYYYVRMIPRQFNSLSTEWNGFQKLDKGTKEAVIEAVEGADTALPIVRFKNEPFENYLKSRDAMSPAVGIFPIPVSDGGALAERPSVPRPISRAVRSPPARSKPTPPKNKK